MDDVDDDDDYKASKHVGGMDKDRGHSSSYGHGSSTNASPVLCFCLHLRLNLPPVPPRHHLLHESPQLPFPLLRAPTAPNTRLTDPSPLLRGQLKGVLHRAVILLYIPPKIGRVVAIDTELHPRLQKATNG